MPQAYIDTTGVNEFQKLSRSLDYLSGVLDPLDMERVNTIVIDKSTTCDSAILTSNKVQFARAQVGGLETRQRNRHSMGILRAVVPMLPGEGFGAKDVVSAAMVDKVQAGGGTNHTLGRLTKAYPRLGAPPPRRPVTKAEAKTAIRQCGLDMGGLDASQTQPYPLFAEEGDDRVLQVNPNSDNAFPVLKTWADPEARAKCLGYAQSFKAELEAAYRRGGRQGVAAFKREGEAERPSFFALRGKAKADCYTAVKVTTQMLRFYNAFPRHLMLNLQMVTQPLERYAQSALDATEEWPYLRSAIGVPLVRGGADRLVEAMERQFGGRDGAFAYVHVGDDSWVVFIERGVGVVMFALDCSNFDLTQHAAFTKEVHEALYQELRRFGEAPAALWYEYMRERVVVVASSLARRMKHAGPSGAPLQSKVNDLLMDVVLQRVEEYADKNGTLWLMEEASVDSVLQQIGKDAGLSIRVEQYAFVEGAASLRQALERQPFLFIGYYFYAMPGGEVRVCCDVPRTLAQLPYPGMKWVKEKTDGGLGLLSAEAMRLGSIAINMGVAPPLLRPAFEVFREEACKLLVSALTVEGDSDSPSLRWAVEENPFAAETQKSLSGLLRALKRRPEELWLSVTDVDRWPMGREDEDAGEEPVPAASEELAASSSSSTQATEVSEEPKAPSPSKLPMPPRRWADEVDDAERGQGEVRPAAAVLPPAQRIPRGRVPTHPPTRLNDGRQPPTVVWAPPRPPRAAMARTTLGGGRTGRNARRSIYEEQEDEESSLGGFESDVSLLMFSGDDAWSVAQSDDTWG